MSVPSLETDRLVLKAITKEDAHFYHQNFVDYEVIKNLAAGVPWPYPENGISDFIEEVILPSYESNERWIWGLFLKDNLQEIIGVIDLWKEGHPEHRGFWLAKKHWNKGLMTEANFPVIDYAFNTLGFKELIFSNALGNIASRKIKEKTGARFLRIEKGDFVDSTFTEREIWSLDKRDWSRFKSSS